MTQKAVSLHFFDGRGENKFSVMDQISSFILKTFTNITD